jgi:pimeloyl-ACP methyl ester carboxylesterase
MNSRAVRGRFFSAFFFLTFSASLRGGQLYYEVAGEGYPLVLIHGGQMDSRMRDEQVALFSKSYRVIQVSCFDGRLLR